MSPKDNKHEIDLEKYYENMMIKNGLYSNEILSAIELVAKYIKREKLILVGGMAIDMALKMKGSGIYDENTIADHDFYSKNHFMDAYEIGQWLLRTKYTDISVINALHASTMKVRVKFEPVADVSYMPPVLFDQLPTICYRGYTMIHPHFQMIGQHRALCNPYESKPRETIRSGRWEKDMKRHDLLYQYYPLKLTKEQFRNIDLNSVKLDVLENQDYCFTGLAALLYWMREASKFGFEKDNSFGSFSETEIRLRGKVALLTDSHEELFQVFKSSDVKFYNRQIDHLPRSFRCNNFEVFDNLGEQVSASAEGNFHVANLQTIMVYFLTRLIVNKSDNEDYLRGYLRCRDLIKWASKLYEKEKNPDKKQFYEKLFPSIHVYGKQYIFDTYMIKKAEKREKRIQLQPKHMYGLINMSIPEKLKEFKYKDSWVFDFDGQETACFYSGKNEN